MLCSHHLLKETFCRRNIALSAEHKLDCISFLVYGAVKIFTCLTNLDVCLINSIRSAAHFQMLADSLIDLRGITLYPAEHGRVIHLESALAHHLFHVAVR